jgi:carbonic anhydrase/acetyltransferase-like protein (isoleucine patch superfamily)
MKPPGRLAAAMMWVAPSAVIVGDVTVGDEASVWHGAVLRGDHDAIVVGRQSNIQDNCVVHVDEGLPARIGDRVVVGHGAIVHGCTIEDACTIGMGAIVTSRCVVGTQSFVAAGAVLAEGTVVPPRSVALGVPARVQPASAEHLARIDRGWRDYVELARRQLPSREPMRGDAALRAHRAGP